MKLTQAEWIQVLRRRTSLNQGDFGARAFNTSYESGRTKVKNIELGKQIPTAEDIRKMARVLGVDESELQAATNDATDQRTIGDGDTVISAEVLNAFPGFGTYLDMLDKAVRIGDTELIGHIAKKAAAILNNYGRETTPDVTTGA